MYQHCILLETYVNTGYSVYTVIFTNDTDYFERLQEERKDFSSD